MYDWKACIFLKKTALCIPFEIIDNFEFENERALEEQES